MPVYRVELRRTLTLHTTVTFETASLDDGEVADIAHDIALKKDLASWAMERSNTRVDSIACMDDDGGETHLR